MGKVPKHLKDWVAPHKIVNNGITRGATLKSTKQTTTKKGFQQFRWGRKLLRIKCWVAGHRWKQLHENEQYRMGAIGLICDRCLLADMTTPNGTPITSNDYFRAGKEKEPMSNKDIKTQAEEAIVKAVYAWADGWRFCDEKLADAKWAKKLGVYEPSLVYSDDCACQIDATPSSKCGCICHKKSKEFAKLATTQILSLINEARVEELEQIPLHPNFIREYIDERIKELKEE